MTKYLRAVTPAECNQHVMSLCAELSPGEHPFYVEVQANAGEPHDECFHVVNRHIERLGGTAVIGWAIWELPTVFVEAEFHAVWQSPAGEFLDVAPKSTPTERVFFLPDRRRKYEGFPLDNVRRPITSAPEVREFISAMEAKYEIMNRSGRAKEHAEIRLTDSEALEFRRIESVIAQLGLLVFALHPHVGPYTPCVCGSGKKSKWCHRPT